MRVIAWWDGDGVVFHGLPASSFVYFYNMYGRSCLYNVFVHRVKTVGGR